MRIGKTVRVRACPDRKDKSTTPPLRAASPPFKEGMKNFPLYQPARHRSGGCQTDNLMLYFNSEIALKARYCKLQPSCNLPPIDKYGLSLYIASIYLSRVLFGLMERIIIGQKTKINSHVTVWHRNHSLLFAILVLSTIFPFNSSGNERTISGLFSFTSADSDTVINYFPLKTGNWKLIASN